MRFNRKEKICIIVALFSINFIAIGALLKLMSVNYHEECPVNNIITIRGSNSLGKCIWEYVAVLGLHGPLRLTPYIPKGLLKCLERAFKNLSIPTYEESLLSYKCKTLHGGDYGKCKSRVLHRGSNSWDRLCNKLTRGKSISPKISNVPISILMKLKKNGKLPSILILPKRIELYYAFAQIGTKRLKEEMKFRDDIKKLAEKTLNGVREKVGHNNLTFVGVHVRRKVHEEYFRKEKLAIADVHYYERAFSRMHDLYNDTKLAFVVVSDDYYWCVNNLVNEKKRIFWGGLEHSGFIDKWEEIKEIGVSHDLAVLSMQNHSISGYGKYAVTGSLLSGGHMIFRNLSKNGLNNNFLTYHLCKVLPNCELL